MVRQRTDSTASGLPLLSMIIADELSERAERLRETAEQEHDQTVALLCRAVAEAYETLAAVRQFRSLNQPH